MLGIITPTSLILVLIIVALLFGTKRVRDMGADLGAAYRSFKKGLHEDEQAESNPQHLEQTANKNTHDSDKPTS
jgi:sec-independent protein translocase protein TatA